MRKKLLEDILNHAALIPFTRLFCKMGHQHLDPLAWVTLLSCPSQFLKTPFGLRLHLWTLALFCLK